MKLKFLSVFVVCATLFAQFGCSNEVEVIGIWKDIPVVYGVIDQTKDTNYIRIERAYLPPNKSALEVAKNIDSLYFDTSEVDIKLYYVGFNGEVLWDTSISPGLSFERVDLVAEGIVRDSGIFAHNPSYAYRVIGKTSLDLILKINNNKTGHSFSARTESIVADPSNGSILFMTPTYFSTPDLPVKFRDFNTQNEEIYASLIVEMTDNGFAAIYDYKFRFHYTEYQIDNQGDLIAGTEVSKSIIWKAVSDYIPFSANQTQKVINGEGFYRFLADNLTEVGTSNLRRCAGHLEVFVDGGSQSLKDYIVARQANEGFVGGLYPAEPYSNVVGGFGVFATSDRLEREDFQGSAERLMKMSNLTYEYIVDGEHTKNLGFQSSTTPCY